MGQFFRLMDDRVSQARWHLAGPVDAQREPIDSWQFKEGKTLELGCVPLFPLQTPGAKLDFTFAGRAVPVVSARFRETFARLAIPDVQFIPARVEGHGGPHFILNALRVVRSIDDARTEEVQYWTAEDNEPDRVGEYQAVHGLRIDPLKVGDAQIFRTWGWLVALIVSEDIKDAIVHEGLTGAELIEV